MPHAEPGRERSKSKERPRLELTSTAFTDGEGIPQKFTGDGDDLSPPLHWSDPPAATESFALLCEDPDAPSGLFTHWTAWNIDPDQRDEPKGIAPGAREHGIHQGANGFGQTGYGGPMPPPGKPHRYRFRVYALDARPSLRSGASRSEFDRAIRDHVVAEGVLTGIYGR
jgi:Raf kinase inhibitor-like YbhB/YbcL family protein